MATGRVTISRYRLTAACLVGCSVAGLFLGACGGQSPDLEERIAQLQKELDRTQNELKTANQALEASKEELARAKSAPGNTKVEPTAASPTPAPARTQLPVPSRDVLEASYIAEAKVLKKQLQERLKQYTLGSFTLHNVILPDNQFPISSWISLAFQAGDGKQYRLDFPVKADLAGKWVFPEPEEIGRRISEGKKVTATTDSSQKSAPQTAPKEPTSSTVPADSTVVIQWPGSSPAPQAPQAPQTPQTPQAPQDPNKSRAQTSPAKPQTSPPPGPKQSIPADRDVLIRF